MFLNNPFPGAFGLDIGDLTIKLVQLRRHKPFGKSAYFSVQASRSTNLIPGAIVDGIIQQPEIVRKKILHLLGSEGPYKPIGTPWVVADLPESQTFLKLIEIDTPTSELMYEDVSYHAARHLPFEIDSTYLDWQVVNSSDPNSKTSQVLIGAVPKIIADSYTDLLESVGLSPLALEIEAISIARAMITDTKDYIGEARAIFDLGATRSSITVYDKNSIQFSIHINFSGEQVTTALMQAMGLPYEAAEKMKIANGLAYDKSNPAYLKVVDTMVDSLVGEITRALEFYKNHFPGGNEIKHITMCGGLSYLQNLSAILSHKLRISSHPGNAWKNVSNEKPTEEKRQKGAELASAIGLALRAVQNPLT